MLAETGDWSGKMIRLTGTVVSACAALALAACASTTGGVSTAVNTTSEGIGDAALTPLNDFNLRRTEVPARLAALQSAYEPLLTPTCETIAYEVDELTKILGPDADAPAGPEAGLGEQAGEGAANLALGGVASLATDFIPFRSVVREATGASAHERRLRAAYERGVTRRAYLKGVGAQMGCAPPAAPQPGAGIPPPPRSEYRGNVQPD
jgi:hypothetical protein